MEDIELNIPEVLFENDFTIIYEGREESEGNILEPIDKIKTSKREFLRKLRYFTSKSNEINKLNEIFIHDEYPVHIFRSFIDTLQTKHLRINESNYSYFLDLSSKYQYHELKDLIIQFSQNRPDLNCIIDNYNFDNFDPEKEEKIAKHLDICLKNDNMVNFPIPVIIRILNSPKQVLNDHHLLFNFIKKILEKNKSKEDENCQILVSSLNYLEMSNEELDEFFNNEKFSSIFGLVNTKEKMKNLFDENEKIFSQLERRIQVIENKNKENEQLQIIIKQIQDKIQQQDNLIQNHEKMISDLQNENKKYQNLVQNHEKNISDLQNENKKLQIAVQKQEEEFKIEKECKITGQITASVSTNQLITGTIKLNENGGKLDTARSKYIINKDSSSSLQETLFDNQGSLIKSLNQEISYVDSTGTYFIHALVLDMNGRSRQIVSSPLTLKNNIIKTFSPQENNTISGIIDFLRKQNNGNIDNEINITASSYHDDSHLPKYALSFDDLNKYYCSKNTQGSWIMFEFKNYHVLPTSYTIRTFYISDGGHLKNWVFEISNDNISWEIIDDEKDVTYLNGPSFVHTFNVQKQVSKEVRYIRIRSTGKDCRGKNWLLMNLFEVYGNLYK